MARRGDHSKDELREMIIDAARSIIEQEGIANLSARRIAKEIGYTVGTIYNFFENIDDLILHINADTLDELSIYLSESLEENENEAESLKALAKAYFKFSQSEYNKWSILFENNLSPNNTLPGWYHDHINELFKIVEKSLEEEFDKDEINIPQHSKTIWSAIHGICHLHHLGKLNSVNSDSAEELIDNLIETYQEGIC